MLLLTWHGTIIRLEKASGRLSHAGLVPQRDVAVDFNVDLPPEGLTAPLTGPNGMAMLPGEAPGTAHLARGGAYFSVGHTPYPAFSGARIGPWETLLLIAEDDAAMLRDVLSHAWVRGDTGATILPGDIAMGSGPALRLGGLVLALDAHGLAVDPGLPDTVVISPLDGAASGRRLVLNRVRGSRVDMREVAISPRPGALLPEVSDEVFRAGGAGRLTLQAPPELGLPPILGSVRDRDFIYRRGWKGLPPTCGRRQLHSQVVRERNRYVLPDLHGMILDESGRSNHRDIDAAYFKREGDQVFIDLAVLERAPLLGGAFVVLQGAVENYHDWLLGAMVQLSLLAPYLPDNATLLLPDRLARTRLGRVQFTDLLDAFGFGAMQRMVAPNAICRAEEVCRAERCSIGEVPAVVLRAMRDRALMNLPAADGPRRRIYIRRTGARSVANAALIDGVLNKNGFAGLLMEELTASEQIDLFRHAEIVVAPHGAGLANLIYCPAGTQVLEFSPDCEYRPFFNEIAGKLGLSHAVLPCPTADGSFDGAMTVDARRLHLLLTMLLSRQAA